MDFSEIYEPDLGDIERIDGFHGVIHKLIHRFFTLDAPLLPRSESFHNVLCKAFKQDFNSKFFFERLVGELCFQKAKEHLLYFKPERHNLTPSDEKSWDEATYCLDLLTVIKYAKKPDILLECFEDMRGKIEYKDFKDIVLATKGGKSNLIDLSKSILRKFFEKMRQLQHCLPQFRGFDLRDLQSFYVHAKKRRNRSKEDEEMIELNSPKMKRRKLCEIDDGLDISTKFRLILKAYPAEVVFMGMCFRKDRKILTVATTSEIDILQSGKHDVKHIRRHFIPQKGKKGDEDEHYYFKSCNSTRCFLSDDGRFLVSKTDVYDEYQYSIFSFQEHSDGSRKLQTRGHFQMHPHRTVGMNIQKIGFAGAPFNLIVAGLSNGELLLHHVLTGRYMFFQSELLNKIDFGIRFISLLVCQYQASKDSEYRHLLKVVCLLGNCEVKIVTIPKKHMNFIHQKGEKRGNKTLLANIETCPLFSSNDDETYGVRKKNALTNLGEDPRNRKMKRRMDSGQLFMPQVDVYVLVHPRGIHVIRKGAGRRKLDNGRGITTYESSRMLSLMPKDDIIMACLAHSKRFIYFIKQNQRGLELCEYSVNSDPFKIVRSFDFDPFCNSVRSPPTCMCAREGVLGVGYEDGLIQVLIEKESTL